MFICLFLLDLFKYLIYFNFFFRSNVSWFGDFLIKIKREWVCYIFFFVFIYEMSLFNKVKMLGEMISLNCVVIWLNLNCRGKV